MEAGRTGELLVVAGLTDSVLPAVPRLPGQVAPDTLRGGAGRQLQAPQSVVPSQAAVLLARREVSQHTVDRPQQGLLLTAADITETRLLAIFAIRQTGHPHHCNI